MELILPFKPFTYDEVSRITEVPMKLLDVWCDTRIQPKTGDDRITVGLEYMQCFAVFVGWRWMEEGSGPDRAGNVVEYIASMSLDHVMENIKFGRSFPVPAIAVADAGAVKGVMVQAPNTRLGKTLNLDVLHKEFRARLTKEFPKG